MYLTGNMILDRIEKEFHVLEKRNIGEVNKLCGVLCLDECMEAEAEWVYVTEQWENVQSVDSLFVLIGEASEDLPPDASVIVLESNTSVNEALNCVMKVFAAFLRWEEKANRLIQSGGTLQTFLKNAISMTGNALVLYRRDLSVAAYAAVDEDDEMELQGQLWMPVHGDERMELLNTVAADPGFSSNQDAQICYPGPEHIMGIPSLFRNIRENNKTVYRLCLVFVRERPNEADVDFLEILAEKLQLLLRSVIRTEEGNRENMHGLFRQILSNTIQDFGEISTQLSELGWDKDDEYMCLALQPTFQKRPLMSAESICSYMEESFPECCSFTFQDHVITFFRLYDREVAGEIENNMKPFIRDGLLKAGYSRITKGHLYLRRMYQQSMIALSIGNVKTPYIWIHHFDRLAMEYIIDQITLRMPAEMICHKGLIKLRENDMKNDTELVKTLEAWICCQGNATEAAKELFIHRSTFLYRMDRIRAIMESDLEDPDERLYLGLSLKLMDKTG